MYAIGNVANLVRTPLHLDLRQCLAGNVLKHPLIQFEHVQPRIYSRLNQLLVYRQGLAGKTARERNDWERLRPNFSAYERLNWFLRKLLMEPKAVPKSYENIPERYYQICGHLWSDPELLTNTSDVLCLIFRVPLPSKPVEPFMIESERRQLAELPDELPVFRGHQGLEHGVCWTLNPQVALDWAFTAEPEVVKQWNNDYPDVSMYYGTPIVTTGIVQKSQIIALVSRRNEDEILVDPRFVRDRQSYTLPC
jgi:hypothetical protein